MKNKGLIARKTERAKRILARSVDLKPPKWVVVWLGRHQ